MKSRYFSAFAMLIAILCASPFQAHAQAEENCRDVPTRIQGQVNIGSVRYCQQSNGQWVETPRTSQQTAATLATCKQLFDATPTEQMSVAQGKMTHTCQAVQSPYVFYFLALASVNQAGDSHHPPTHLNYAQKALYFAEEAKKSGHPRGTWLVDKVKAYVANAEEALVKFQNIQDTNRKLKEVCEKTKRGNSARDIKAADADRSMYNTCKSVGVILY